MNEHIRRAIRNKEVQVEHQINLFRMVLWLGFVSFDAVYFSLHPVSTSFLTVFVLIQSVAAFFLFCIHLLTRKKHYFRWLKYVTITADFFVLFVISKNYRAFGIYQNVISHDAEMLVDLSVVLLLLLLSALRYSRIAVLYAGFLAMSYVVASALIVASSIWLALISFLIVFLASMLIYLFSKGFHHLFIQVEQRNTLIPFLPEAVVKKMERGEVSLSLGGEEKEVTILLVDIRDFTALSQTMSPSELIDLLNLYLTQMTEVVLEHGGSINKYMGDALLAVFGCPIPQPGDPKRALFAALHMLEELKSLNALLEEQGKPTLQVGMAMHTGPVILGNVGSPRRMEFTVIGSTVNIAAHIEPLNKEYGTTLLLTEESYQWVKDHFQSDKTIEARVRGVETPMKLYAKH